MTERLLQFIWQFQYFNTGELATTSGEKIYIIHPGQWNHHQGPDFTDARIKISQKIWAGNVELHIFASDWHKHLHQRDRSYDNVILHVVWHNDDMPLADRMSTLVLGDRIPKILLQQYEWWMLGSGFIPCAGSVHTVGLLIWTMWKERLLVERLERKCGDIQTMLERNTFHWAETLWWMLARNFGLSVNAEAFEYLAQSIPFAVLIRHRMQLQQLEALLMGQAGLLLPADGDAYFLALKKEYEFYKIKYRLEPINCPVHFLRMRPSAFPTVRLAQLAMLIHSAGNLLTCMLEAETVRELKVLLQTTAGDYWNDHFTFRRVSPCAPKTLGAGMINNIIINTVSPVVFSYGHFHQHRSYMDKALAWLAALAAEKNAITKGFSALFVANRNAAESQALIELKSQYCDKRRCLDCAVGNSILKKSV